MKSKAGRNKQKHMLSSFLNFFGIHHQITSYVYRFATKLNTPTSSISYIQNCTNVKKNLSSLWSTQNIQATLLLVFNSEVIKFNLVFAAASPAKHIGDNHAHANYLGSESYKLSFAKREWQHRKTYEQLNEKNRTDKTTK